ncbi:undecaprenyl-phosphate galactose phosphotransferase WbaP [Limnohabitans sp. Rim8]|uniref:undecaprenyl-phosphate galactose phosphotransferase WbaP n=1 Tax=Limnohabitans sp. Rim8 TaxID=1100718 RepID=UPI0025FECAF6|nr:undecaprenyl-phosphate galactose phosphotransferase WbaP [Limnohabitans sp. Rim8]
MTKAVLLGVDVVALLVSGLLAALLAQLWAEPPNAQWLVTQDVQRYWAWLGVAGVGLGFFLVRFRHYSDRKPFWSELGETMIALLVLAVLDLAVLALTRWNSSRLWWALVWPLAMLCVPLGRGLARSLMRRAGVWQRPTLIVGNGPNAHEAVAALNSEPALGFAVVEFIDAAQASTALTKKLKQWAQVPGVQFVLALEHGQNDLREDLLRRLAHWKAEDVSVVPAMRGVPLFGTDMSYFFSHEVAMLKLRNNLRYWPARLLKRVFDLFAALVLLVLGALPLLYIALRIRRDGGPAMFAHQRVGQSGKVFPCFKFRTMQVDAEERLRELLANDPAARAEWEREFKLRNDPRITPIGQFLRRTSLDELPQLFNVIRGEMSLVGPRPVIRAELARYGDDVDYFLMVRPGMTGLWQVSGRNDTSYETRVYLDTWYVKNWSLWYDIAIMFKTIRVVLNKDGAY